MSQPTLLEISRRLSSVGSPLWNKFRGAVIKAASSVYAEDPATANHANRVLWADNVLLAGNVDARTSELYRLGMTNTTIVTDGDDATDNDVEWVVAYFLNNVARGE
jgi:hypothetical protein